MLVRFWFGPGNAVAFVSTFAPPRSLYALRRSWRAARSRHAKAVFSGFVAAARPTRRWTAVWGAGFASVGSDRVQRLELSRLPHAPLTNPRHRYKRKRPGSNDPGRLG